MATEVSEFNIDEATEVSEFNIDETALDDDPGL